MKQSWLVSLLTWVCLSAQGAPAYFGLIGDMPYSAWAEQRLPLLMAEMLSLIHISEPTRPY